MNRLIEWLEREMEQWPTWALVAFALASLVVSVWTWSVLLRALMVLS